MENPEELSPTSVPNENGRSGRGPSRAFVVALLLILALGGAAVYIQIREPALFERILVSLGFESVFLATSDPTGKFK